MANPVSFQRIYRDHGPDVEHVCQRGTVAAVLRAMNEAGDLNPFKVLFRLDDGSTVTVKPKRGRA